MGKNNRLNLDLDATLGGATPSNYKSPSQKAIKAYVDNAVSPAYGIEFDTTVSSPELTRIGNMAKHRSLPVQNGMRGCLLDDNGNVVEYLPANDWTSSVRDGSRGQVMVEIPEYFIKFEEEGTKRRVWISEVPFDGCIKKSKMYISAYEAVMDRTNNKLCSIVNTDAQYRGGNDQSDWDGTYRSMLGKPVTEKSLTIFRTLARARKSGSYEWNCYTYEAHKSLYWLYVVEYANFNSQKDYDASLTAEGYKKGGLGAGVTNSTGAGWSSFNDTYPLVNCGVSDELGNRTGTKNVQVLNADSSVFLDTNVPRYRGIENPFGHIWKMTDGILIKVGADSDTGKSEVYTTPNPQDYDSSITDKYVKVGEEARSSGYAKHHIFGQSGEIVPSSIGGSSSTYMCDFRGTNIPSSGSAVRVALLSGRVDDSSGAGLAHMYTNFASSFVVKHLGSRLCFIPNND